MDTKEEIERAIEEITKDTGKSKLEALKMLFSRYKSQKRLEEAVRVKNLLSWKTIDLTPVRGRKLVGAGWQIEKLRMLSFDLKGESNSMTYDDLLNHVLCKCEK